MIFNTPLFLKSNISPEEFICILIIKNADYSYLQTMRNSLNSLFKKGMVEIIKGDKKTPAYIKARLTKKAKDWFRDIQIPHISDEVKQLAVNLQDVYIKSGMSDKIGNKRQIVRTLAWFTTESGLSDSRILSLASDYIMLQDPKFVASLENLLWKPKNIYSTKPKLEESKLFQLSQK